MLTKSARFARSLRSRRKKSARRNTAARRLFLETLESRRLLAIDGLGLAGDSLTDQYFDASYGAYAKNWARSGADSTSLLTQGQHTSLAQDINSPQTTGLFHKLPGTSDGYTLFSPNQTTSTYLMDKDGNIINEWVSAYTPGLHAYLLPDGSLIRPAGAEGNSVIGATGGGGLIERFDWNGIKVWEFDYNDDSTFEDAVWQHHDIEVMPNGNILMIAWEAFSDAEAEQAGRDNSLPGGNAALFPDHIVEVQPDLVSGVGGTVVWEWHATDHLVQDHDSTKDNSYDSTGGVAGHPELIDINYVSDGANGGGAANDWLHANGIDYNANLDQIVLSVREFSEFWIIDHSTTTAQAAGHSGGTSGKGGDLLYRWGNPQTYDAGDENDRTLFFQHDPKWIEPGHPGEGNITIFNNGWGGPNLSSVNEIQTTVDGSGNYPVPTSGTPHGGTVAFEYTAPLEDYSQIISGTQRLENGNTLITFGGDGTFVEVTSTGQEVWRYTNPYISSGMLGPTDPTSAIGFADLDNNFVFRATDYASDYFVAVLDVNEDGIVDASTDGNLVLANLFGLPDANLTPFRGSASLTNQQIAAKIQRLATDLTLDVNEDGTVDASTDGNLILVNLFGLPESNLTPFRGGTLLTNQQILENIDDLKLSWLEAELALNSLQPLVQTTVLADSETSPTPVAGEASAVDQLASEGTVAVPVFAQDNHRPNLMPNSTRQRDVRLVVTSEKPAKRNKSISSESVAAADDYRNFHYNSDRTEKPVRKLSAVGEGQRSSVAQISYRVSSELIALTLTSLKSQLKHLFYDE